MKTIKYDFLSKFYLVFTALLKSWANPFQDLLLPPLTIEHIH